MTLLDTDHLSIFKYPESPNALRLRARMAAAHDETFGTTIVTVEEQLRGWLAYINRYKDIHKQLQGYERLQGLLLYLRDWEIVPLDAPTADQFVELRRQKVRIGTSDLKIAAIALTHDATILSANLRDFRQVPGLKVDNWLQ